MAQFEDNNRVMTNNQLDRARERFASMNRHNVVIAQLARDSRPQTIYPLHRAVIELTGFVPVILAYACRACSFAEPQTDEIQGLRVLTLPVALQVVKDGFTAEEIIQEGGHDIAAILKATAALYKDGFVLVFAELPRGQEVE